MQLRAARRVASLFQGDARVLGLMLAFNLVVRVASLGVVANPDAVIKWAAARSLLHGVPLAAGAFDHHAARWGINLPILAAQAIFGEGAWVYYVPVLAITTLLATFTFLVGRAIADRWVGALAILIYSPLPALTYMGSHLMPEGFEACYVMGAVWALLRSFEEPGRRFLWISIAFFCGAYMAKETAVFALPGLVVGVYLGRRKIWEAVAYGATFVGFFGMETLAYRLTYGFELGRASIISRHHMGHPKLRAPIESVWDLFQRYLELRLGFRELFYAALVAAVVLLVRKRPAAFDRRGLLTILAVCASFLLATTFALKGLNPPRLAQPMNERYLYPVTPFLAIIVATFLRSALQGFALPARLRPFPVLVTFTLGLAAILWLSRSPPGKEHAMVTMVRYQSLVREAFVAGKPIVSLDQKRHATGAVIDFFLSFDQSQRARVGYPPRTRRQRPRVIVDGANPKYQARGRKALSRTVRNWREGSHLVVSMVSGFVIPDHAPPR